MILSHPGIGEVPVQDKTVVVDSVVMGRRTSPSSYDWNKFLVNVLIAVRTFFVV